MDDELKPEQMLIDKVLAAMKVSELDLTLTAPVQTAHLFMEGGRKVYKQKPLLGNETFVLTGMREGKRSEFIFEFEPVDDRPYKHVEFGDKVAMQVFAGLEDELIKALELDKQVKDWKQAAAAFRTKVRREAKRAVEAAEKDAKRSTEEHYKNDPLYGAWG